MTVAGPIDRIESGGVALATVIAMVPLPLRACASVIEKASEYGPGVTVVAAVVVAQNSRSPGVVSQPVPSSTSACVALPPRAVRSAVTARPVLGGFVPGVTTTRSALVVAPSFGIVDGVAVPVPAGGVGAAGTGAKTTPRKAVLVAAVAITSGVPVIASSKAAVSTTRTSVVGLAVVVAKISTVAPTMRAAIPRACVASVPRAVHSVPSNENFRMPPPDAMAASSATYSVSGPATAVLRSSSTKP